MPSNEAPVVPAFCLPSSRGESHCSKTIKVTSLSFRDDVYYTTVFLCCKFERDRWSHRGAIRQTLLEANGRTGAILTTVASRGSPQWLDSGCFPLVLLEDNIYHRTDTSVVYSPYVYAFFLLKPSISASMWIVCCNTRNNIYIYIYIYVCVCLRLVYTTLYIHFHGSDSTYR